MTPPAETDAKTAGTSPIAADQLSLAPRPTPGPDVLAVIASAVQLAWPQPMVIDDAPAPTQTWRFSGRWWHQAGVTRRERPRSGR